MNDYGHSGSGGAGYPWCWPYNHPYMGYVGVGGGGSYPPVPTVKAADWTSVIRGERIEVEKDLNARPGSAHAYRWRKRAYTGDPIPEWTYGAKLP